ncbi:CAP domain-containing protein [Paraflavitalea sp. CAU 1676]|uniref:CAP domain-containing protein n=1 Tax=Paraflavitalea sp. CAU 1676 TaxID=3032598 RepID=UPI0023DA9419|nr:CAP domain-containing protein [Paraflavitalea sp. CAU 1676]MDF2192835.1 CAP domain-containing protein [Paraflavitalea sp. CAU 1676]
MHRGLSYTILLYISTFVIAFSSCSSSKPSTSSSKPSGTTSRPSVPKPSTASVAPALEDQILTLVNQHRKKMGLAPLQSNSVIETEARRHTVSMASKKTPFGHNGFNYRSKVITTKVQGITATAENVAYGSRSAQEVVEGWLNSPGHRKNIEGRYRLTGIGVARDSKSTLYFTQIFAN